jgi:predicted ATPase
MKFNESSYKNIVNVNFNNKIGDSYLFFDTEKHNPRMRSDLEKRKDMPNMPGLLILQSRFMSHGETILPLIEKSKTAKNTVLFVDEPEAGLSIRSQYKIVKSFKKALNNNCQLFICTHSPIIMKTFDEVLSLEHMSYMKYNDFIKTQQ